MNSLKQSRLMRFAVLTALLLSLGRSATAQDIQGKFELPFPAHWGGIVLTPGQYSFSYAPLANGGIPVVVLRQGMRKLGMITGYKTESGQRYSVASHLTAIRVGSTYRIISLQFSAEGTTVGFHVPKVELVEAAQSHSARDIPVLQAAK